ncbi:MAG TPA: hypothetical protein VH934_21880, partial [Xanthobacteraceae bacterium]
GGCARAPSSSSSCASDAASPRSLSPTDDDGVTTPGPAGDIGVVAGAAPAMITARNTPPQRFVAMTAGFMSMKISPCARFASAGELCQRQEIVVVAASIA